MVCAGESGGCRNNGVTYEVKCKKCDHLYIGETGRNAYTRGLEHIEGMKNKNEESVLHKHNIENHEGNLTSTDFVMVVTGTFGGDATKRQIAEATKIRYAQGPSLMNRKDEWRQFNLPHVDL